MGARLGLVGVLAAFTAVGPGCVGGGPLPTLEQQLGLAATALANGKIEDASALVADARKWDPRHVDAARWSSLLADMYWRDEEAVRELKMALRWARVMGLSAASESEPASDSDSDSDVPLPPPSLLSLDGDLPDALAFAERDASNLAALRGRLGELLFQAGRWGESSAPLLDGALGPLAERRRAFAMLASSLPFVRRFAGPLLTEQPLLRGATPEFVCGIRGRLRPFAIDTGTSMTTVAASFAEELGVRSRQLAGEALDGAGQRLAVEVGALPQFRIGNVDIGAVPIMIVSDRALELRDLHGGPERVPRGVLGLDLLAACRLTIDPDRGSVVLELPQGLPRTESVQCLRVDGRCLVPVVVEGRRLWFVLDTGASHSSLSLRGLRDLSDGATRATPSFRRVRTAGGGVMAVKEVRDLVIRCSDARFLHVTLPVVDRGDETVFPIHGVLGIDLLHRCLLTLDRGRLRLAARG
ncbi:MAG: retropepsin-like aspartic protease [Planctomycetota bacterium]